MFFFWMNYVFRQCCKTHDLSFKNGWFWMSDIASSHKLDKTSIETEVNDVNVSFRSTIFYIFRQNVWYDDDFWFSQSTIKFNVNLKGCQIGWKVYFYIKDNLESDLNCSFDLDTIPYEFVVTKNHKTNHVEATFKFAGMHSPRMVILSSIYLPPNTEFVKLLKNAVRIFLFPSDAWWEHSIIFIIIKPIIIIIRNCRWIRTWNSVNRWVTFLL